MANGLQLGVDFVPTGLFDPSQFPSDAYVVKVSKAALRAPTHQKLQVFKDDTGNACVSYNNEIYYLLDGTGYYDPLGKDSGSYRQKTYNSTGTTASSYYGQFIVGAVVGSTTAAANGTWAAWAAQYPGLKANTRAGSSVTIAATEVIMLLLDEKIVNVGPDGNGFNPTEIVYLDLSGVTNSVGSSPLYIPPAGYTDDKLFLDGEPILRLPSSSVTNRTNSIGYYQSQGRVCPFLCSVKIGSTPYPGILVESPTGGWVEPLQGRRVEYLGYNAAMYYAINEQLVPDGYTSPTDLGLTQIKVPPVPKTDSAIIAMVKFIFRLIDFRTLVILGGAYFVYKWYNGGN